MPSKWEKKWPKKVCRKFYHYGVYHPGNPWHDIFRFPAKTEAIHTTLIKSLIRRNWNQIYIGELFWLLIKFRLQIWPSKRNSWDKSLHLNKFWLCFTNKGRGTAQYKESNKSNDLMGEQPLVLLWIFIQSSKAASAQSHQSHWDHNWSDDVFIACRAWVSKCRGH